MQHFAIRDEELPQLVAQWPSHSDQTNRRQGVGIYMHPSLVFAPFFFVFLLRSFRFHWHTNKISDRVSLGASERHCYSHMAWHWPFIFPPARALPLIRQTAVFSKFSLFPCSCIRVFEFTFVFWLPKQQTAEKSIGTCTGKNMFWKVQQNTFKKWS